MKWLKLKYKSGNDFYKNITIKLYYQYINVILGLVLYQIIKMELFFEFESGKIHFSDQGAGETILLLHGYLETSEIWSNFAHKLATKFRIITVDLPGHGNSDIYGESHSMEFMATILKGVINSLNIKRVFLTGHSLGGYVTLAFAELFPEMLSGYCLFHSHPFADSEEILEKRRKEINLVLAAGKDLLYPESVKKMYASVNLEKFSNALKQSMRIASSVSGEGITGVLRGMMTRPSRIAVMEEGTVPCLWILGAMDNYINCELIQTRVRLPQNAKVVVLNNSGHMGFIEEEELSLKVIESFMKKLTRPHALPTET